MFGIVCKGLLVYAFMCGYGSVWAQTLSEAAGLEATLKGPLPTGTESMLTERLNALAEARAEQPTTEADEAQPEPVGDGSQGPRRVADGRPSRIEELLSGELRIGSSEVSLILKQFGYDVFRTPVTTFAPVTNVPVGPDYVIGPGDSFTLTLWGRVDAQHTVQVDRSGQIVLPEVGALRVWGMRFTEMESYLDHELSRKYTDFKMSIVMDRLRTIRVFVVGEAAAPGTYTISSLSTVINALFAAGGPSKNGTMRSVRLSRNGQEPVQIDLYNFLLGGDKSQDLRLQDGDTIFVPLIGPVVGVAGNVKRPAIYEMLGSMTLQDVLDLAGGVTFAGWLRRIQVERVEDHRRRIVVDFDLSGEVPAGGPLDTVMRDGDVVKIFSVGGEEQNVVHLEGHVVRPGAYEWKPGMRLRDLLRSYEVIRSQPNLEYGEIKRLLPPEMHTSTIPFHVGRLLAGDTSQNVELAQYDVVRLFRWDERVSQTVRISGMVFEPNEYRLVPSMRVSDLVDAAGGLMKNAYLQTAEITRSHISQEGMSTEKVDFNLSKALDDSPEDNLLLRDYDHIVVRPIPGLEFNRTAEISGKVRFPGAYPIRKGERLSSLIDRAGGFTDQAYLRGAVFTRESARVMQRRRLDKMIREIEESMLAGSQEAVSGALEQETIQGEKLALQTKQHLLAKLRSAQLTGRVVIELANLEDFKGSKYDVELEDGDQLDIPPRPGVVYVVGEVYNPISLLYEEGETVGYYLRRVGGMTKEADKKHVSVIKANGSVISMGQANRGRLVFWDSEQNGWLFGGFMGHRLGPGDTVVVPRKLDKFLWLKNTKDITQIVFQIAVAAGVFLAI